MFIYLVLITIIPFLGLIFTKKHRKLFIITVCIIMTLVSGLRHYTIGNDTEAYMRSFSLVSTYGDRAYVKSRLEAGYITYNKILTIFSNDYQFFLFITSLIINIAISILIFRKSKNPILSFLLFILFRFFFNEMNIIRQYLSLSIILLGIPFIEKRKFIPYLATVILATTVHTSALFAIILYYLYRNHFNKKEKIASYIITIIVVILLGDIASFITSKIGAYGGYLAEYMDSNKLGSIIQFLISAIEYIFYKHIYNIHKHKIDDKRPYDFLLNITFLCMLMSLCAIRISMASRLIEYLKIFSIIAMPNFISLIDNNKNRMLATITTIAISFAYFMTVTYVRPNWNRVIPYKFYWE